MNDQTSESRELFAATALADVPKILTLLDRNPHSPTYGCFDRLHWHYKVTDFPSGMSQESSYLNRTGLAILRVFLLYRPAQAFFYLRAIPFLAGFALCIRWLMLYFAEITVNPETRGHEPSLIIAAILIVAAVQMWLFGPACRPHRRESQTDRGHTIPCEAPGAGKHRGKRSPAPDRIGS